MIRRLAIPLVALALLASTSTGCIFVAEDDSSLTVYNDSSFPLYELRVADIDDPVYGPNLLAREPLFPGDSITIILDCGTYDVLVVDDIGTECELLSLSLCFDNASWVIDDVELALCNF